MLFQRIGIKVLSAVLYLPFILFSLIISVQDVLTGAVSRLSLWAALLAALLLQGLVKAGLPLSALAGGLVGIAVFSLAFFLSGRRLGLADLWYAGLMGIVFGPLWWHAAIAFACLYALVFFLFSHHRSLPFIPFMTAGSLTLMPLFF
jgi:hypothetical protein